MNLVHISLSDTSGSRDWAKFYSPNGAKFVRRGNLSRDNFNLRLKLYRRPKKAVRREDIDWDATNTAWW